MAGNVSGFGAVFSMLGRIAGLEAEVAADPEQIAHEMAAAMQAELGTYQEGWPALADATQQQRVREGYTPDDPLLRSGQMQSDITAWQGEDGEWRAGVLADAQSAQAALAAELGTLRGEPARPFVQPIADDYGQRMADGIAARVERAI